MKVGNTGGCIEAKSTGIPNPEHRGTLEDTMDTLNQEVVQTRKTRSSTKYDEADLVFLGCAITARLVQIMRHLAPDRKV